MLDFDPDRMRQQLRETLDRAKPKPKFDLFSALTISLVISIVSSYWIIAYLLFRH